MTIKLSLKHLKVDSRKETNVSTMFLVFSLRYTKAHKKCSCSSGSGVCGPLTRY